MYNWCRIIWVFQTYRPFFGRISKSPAIAGWVGCLLSWNSNFTTSYIAVFAWFVNISVFIGIIAWIRPVGFVCAQDMISPHKMRSTFGTMVYKGERDIKQVADVLGHRNITKSQTYYSASDDEIKRQAFRSVRLREKKNQTDGSESQKWAAVMAGWVLK